jgi:hypothetical protein
MLVLSGKQDLSSASEVMREDRQRLEELGAQGFRLGVPA